MSDVARRYARAAVEAAEEVGGEKEVQALATALEQFHVAYRTSADLREVLRNPALQEGRDRVVRALLDELGAPALTANFVRLLADSRRLESLGEIVSQVEHIADERAGRLRAVVRSAIALTEAQRERITRALEKRFGRAVVVQVELAPEILGGLVVTVGDVTLDSSLKHQLEGLREQLGAGR